MLRGVAEDAERAWFAPIMERLAADSEWLAEQGIRLSQWGPDPGTGKVRVYLQRYSDEAGHFLADRYGPDIVVTPSRGSGAAAAAAALKFRSYAAAAAQAASMARICSAVG